MKENMRTKPKLALSKPAQKLIDDFDGSAGAKYYLEDQGNGREVDNAIAAYEIDKTALEVYVAKLQDKLREANKKIKHMQGVRANITW